MTRNFKNMLLTFAAIGAIFTFPGCKGKENKQEGYRQGSVVTIQQSRNFISYSGKAILYQDNKWILKPNPDETLDDYNERLEFLNDRKGLDDDETDEKNVVKLVSIFPTEYTAAYFKLAPLNDETFRIMHWVKVMYSEHGKRDEYEYSRGTEEEETEGSKKGDSNKNRKVQPGIGPFCGDREIDTNF